MARTNARTQRFIGMILDDIQTFLDDFGYHMENREGRWTPPDAEGVWDVVSDNDLMEAHRILQNLIHREGEKNKDRKIGYVRIENVKEA